MTSIEPRFRGYYPATDEQNDGLNPILTIPDWDAQAVMGASPIPNSIEAATAASPAEATDADDWNHAANEQLSTEKCPAAGRLRETIHDDWSISKIGKRFRLTSALPNTIRGVLPGVGIAISLLFLWTIFRGSEDAPNRDVLSQDLSKVIKPIDSEPLRASRPTSVAAQNPTTDSPTVATTSDATTRDATTRDVGNESVEPLFTQIPIIASKSAGDFLKADSDSYSAGEFHDSESQPTHKGSAAEMTVAGQLPGQTGVGTTDTPTQASVATSESERPKSGRFRQKASLVNKLTAPSERANSSESEVATHKGVLSNSPVATRQHRPRSSDREPLEVRPRFNSRYSYETTDPSTFKDPIYNVPPIVRRQTRTNDAQPYSANPQADNRETTGRSRR